MIRPSNAHAPDDGPGPVLMTPRRLADRLNRIALASARLKLAARGLVPYLGGPGHDPLALIFEHLASAALLATDLGANVAVGRVPLDPGALDGTHSPPRPLLDAIEARPMVRRAEAVGERLAERDGVPDTDPAREEPPALPGRAKAKAARKEASRSKPPTDGTIDPAAITPEQLGALDEFNRTMAAAVNGDGDGDGDGKGKGGGSC